MTIKKKTQLLSQLGLFYSNLAVLNRYCTLARVTSLCSLLWKYNMIGPAINREENTPITIPIAMTNAKSKIELPPNNTNGRTATNVVVEVNIVRLNVIFTEWLIMS